MAVSDGLSDNIPPKILPLVFQDELRKAFDSALGGPDLKKLAVGLAKRARNIQVEGRAKQAKPDDICVAILRVPREKATAEKPAEKPWLRVAGEMAEDTFAIIGFENSGKNEIVAAAAFEFRTEIADGTMNKGVFTAMMRELNGIAKSYETQLGRPQEQKLPWPQVAGDMSRNNIAGTAFETTGSRIVAAAGYRFREGILRSQDQGASFKNMMKEVSGAVGKYRGITGKS